MKLYDPNSPAGWQMDMTTGQQLENQYRNSPIQDKAAELESYSMDECKGVATAVSFLTDVNSLRPHEETYISRTSALTRWLACAALNHERQAPLFMTSYYNEDIRAAVAGMLSTIVGTTNTIKSTLSVLSRPEALACKTLLIITPERFLTPADMKAIKAIQDAESFTNSKGDVYPNQLNILILPMTADRQLPKQSKTWYNLTATSEARPVNSGFYRQFTGQATVDIAAYFADIIRQGSTDPLVMDQPKEPANVKAITKAISNIDHDWITKRIFKKQVPGISEYEIEAVMTLRGFSDTVAQANYAKLPIWFTGRGLSNACDFLKSLDADSVKHHLTIGKL